MKQLSFYIGLVLFLMVLNSPSASAQHLCFTTKVSDEKADALLMVYAQINYIPEQADTLKNPYELASFSTKLGFDAGKMDFVNVVYNTDLWESVFADPNPNIEQGKGKKGTNLYLSAVDFKPSTRTTISKPTLLYTARFRSKSGKGASIKQKDFRLAYSELDTMTNQAVNPMIAYATYEGKEYPIQSCDAPPSPERDKPEEEDMISFFAPNPACDVVELHTLPIQNEHLKSSEMVHFLLYDLDGKAKLHEQIQARVGERLQWELSLEGLEQGLYIALVQIGQERYERKLLVMSCTTDETMPSRVNQTINQN